MSDFDPSLKKKKKKKKTVSFDELDDAQSDDQQQQQPQTMDGEQDQQEDRQVDDVAEEMGDLVLESKKKKKKKKDAVDTDAPEQAEDNDNDDEEDDSLEDLLKKKKKKKKKAALDTSDPADQESSAAPDNALPVAVGEAAQNAALAAAEAAGDDAWKDSDRDYTYFELLARVFRIIRKVNPDYAGDKRRFVMIPPHIARDGNKKTVFVNINDICRRMHRPPEHLTQFIFAELGTQGSVDGSQRLIIKGRFQQPQIENVLRNYIREYVTCSTCKSIDTTFKKENRLLFVQCESCGSSKSVAAITSGFRAQTAKRKLARQ